MPLEHAWALISECFDLRYVSVNRIRGNIGWIFTEMFCVWVIYDDGSAINLSY
jgi:hypothetical protein